MFLFGVERKPEDRRFNVEMISVTGCQFVTIGILHDIEFSDIDFLFIECDYLSENLMNKKDEKGEYYRVCTYMCRSYEETAYIYMNVWRGIRKSCEIQPKDRTVDIS